MVWPAPEDVRTGVTYGPTGSDYTGLATFGTGETVFASRFSVQVQVPRITVIRRAKISAQPAEAPAPIVRKPAKQSKYVSVCTSMPRLSVVTTQDCISVVSTVATV